MFEAIKNIVRGIGKIFLKLFYPRLYNIEENKYDFLSLSKTVSESEISNLANVGGPYQILNSKIGDYTYIAKNSFISMANIGKFCSIGPNLFCGWGIHPSDGLSTSPVFYSTKMQVQFTLSQSDKIAERKRINIGNDVFIGMNVTILDGITIGDGAMIGAGSVVSKDIPPYAIAVGSPIKIIKYRFPEEQIEKLLDIQWWNFEIEQLKTVEANFF